MADLNTFLKSTVCHTRSSNCRRREDIIIIKLYYARICLPTATRRYLSIGSTNSDASPLDVIIVIPNRHRCCAAVRDRADGNGKLDVTRLSRTYFYYYHYCIKKRECRRARRTNTRGNNSNNNNVCF